MRKRKPFISLKKKPKAPEPEINWTMPCDIEGECKYATIVRWAKKHTLNIKDICFTGYGDGDTYIYYKGDEPQWAFDIRFKNYNERLKKYNQWHSRNKDLIERELLYRAEKAEAASEEARRALSESKK